MIQNLKLFSKVPLLNILHENMHVVSGAWKLSPNMSETEILNLHIISLTSAWLKV